MVFMFNNVSIYGIQTPLFILTPEWLVSPNATEHCIYSTCLFYYFYYKQLIHVYVLLINVTAGRATCYTTLYSARVFRVTAAGPTTCVAASTTSTSPSPPSSCRASCLARQPSTRENVTAL